MSNALMIGILEILEFHDPSSVHAYLGTELVNYDIPRWYLYCTCTVQIGTPRLGWAFRPLT